MDDKEFEKEMERYKEYIKKANADLKQLIEGHKNCEEKIIAPEVLRDLVLDGLHTDGGHHKQWFLQEIAKHLNIEYCEDCIEEGIAP